MQDKNIGWYLLLVAGFFCIAAFSIQHRHFYSGVCGIVGCAMLLAGYWGLHWQEYKRGDRRMKKTLYWLIGLMILLVGLNLIEIFLDRL